MNMTKLFFSMLVVTMSAVPTLFARKADTYQRLDNAAVVLQEVMDVSDKAIPQELLDRAECVVIIPNMKKGAFIVGGKFGRGFAVCRNEDGVGWGAPGSMRIEGGSVGFQIGAKETDLILLIMNRSGAERLTSSKFTIGGEISAAAGPVGRTSTAQTDATMKAEILSYSRSRGLFGGISVQGGTLREDGDMNEDLYAGSKTNKDILLTKTAAPTQSQKLIDTLNKYSSRKKA
jgi:SH3 domain-containing YSC84-like protein 1